MVTLRIRRTVVLLLGALLVLAALAGIVLRIMPPPHRPFEYMIAGTASTAIALAVAFALLQGNAKKG